MACQVNCDARVAEFPELPYVGHMSIESAYPSAHTIDDAFIGRRVHQLMWDQRVTQKALGDVLGMDQSTVAKRLRGKLGWPATLVVRTAHFLNTTTSYLLGETEDPSYPGGPSNMQTPD